MAMPRLQGYKALQNATTTRLGYMPEFVELGIQLIDAYRNYWQTDESLQLSGAMVELGILSQRHGVHFDVERLTRALSDKVGNE
jgi:hypothetical protein